MQEVYFNGVLIVIALLMVWLLGRRSLRRNEVWKATLTPLSSIVGSGFLIMAPMLASTVGGLAPLAVIGIVVLAYAIGSVIRFNIIHVEPKIASGTLGRLGMNLEYLGDIALVLAYVVAVTFYLTLLSSFVLGYFQMNHLYLERIITTVLMIFIGIVGYTKGLHGLEKLESSSMTIQLAIAVSLTAGLAIFGAAFVWNGETLNLTYPERAWSEKFQILAGALLVVQGFETSRFLSDKYSAEVRVKSSRNSQLISGVLYIVTVILFLPIVQHMDLMHIQLSQIVAVTGLVAVVLPTMLIIAALMSQFSAAVADTGGAGGLLRESSQNRLTARISYAAVIASAIVLVWSADLMEIIAMASKAFAAYYLLQTLLAIKICMREYRTLSLLSIARKVLFFGLVIVLGYVVLFAVPAE